MTQKEAMTIKQLIDGAYPIIKNNQDSDLSYVTILVEYDCYLMSLAVKEIIKTSTYPPTIANIVKMYEKVRKEHLMKIVDEMEKKGYFPDTPKGCCDYWTAVECAESGKISDRVMPYFLEYSAKENKDIKHLIGGLPKLLLEEAV
jgi:hypothetical protein